MLQQRHKMADSRWRFVGFLCVVLLSNEVMSSKELLTKMTTGFFDVVDQCRRELNLGENVLQDMYYFWREEYQLINRDFGCIVFCMAGKLDLIGDDQKIHHEKTADFAKSHGAAEDVAKQLVALIHECEKIHTGIADDCNRVLETSKCFRTKIHELKWAPTMEVGMEEIITAV